MARIHVVSGLVIDPLHAIGSSPVHEGSNWSKLPSFAGLSIHLRSSKSTSIQFNC
jgi:hypothetical protein